MLVYDYDRLPFKSEVLPAGSVFQAWEPRAHWRGIKVPITLGDNHREFDWGVTSDKGHFMRWDDFFVYCVIEEGYHQPTNFDSPFAEIASLTGHLMQQQTHISPIAVKLRESAEALQSVHQWAAEMQLGAEGFDNSESAQRYSDVQEHLLAAAQDIAKALQALRE